MQWEDLAKVEQADQTVFSPESLFGGELALTFDDGPGKNTTPRLLDELRRRAAQGVHEKAAGRLAREGRESLFFSGRGKYSR